MAVDLNKLHQRYQALRAERAPWDTAWRDLAAHFLPTKFRPDSESGEDGGRRPEILNRDIVDSTGIQDMRTLAAGMQGGMTSPVRPWFKLTLEDEDAAKGHEAGAWLDEVTRRMQALLHRSNFYNSVHSLYEQLGTFGTGLLIETADWSGLHFQLVPAGEYVLDMNDKNEVDTFMCRNRMSARQLVQAFGEAAVPGVVRQAAQRADSGLTRLFDVIHAVYPRKEGRVSGRLDGANKPFASVWFMNFGGTGKPVVLREAGFQTFPAFAPRWDATGHDKYGRSPAMDVLADCRMLQKMGITVLKGIHKAVDPPVGAPSGMRALGVDLTPGSINYLSPSGPEKGEIVPIQQINPQTIRAAEEKIQSVRQIIHDGLFADLFKMLILNDRRQITATEIEAREREKLILIGPVVERQDKELLSPLILRTFALMEAFDYLPEPPPSIAQSPLRVEFTSVLAQAQRLSSTSPIDQTMAFVAAAAQINPEALDNLDVDKAVQHYADSLGAPASILRSPADVDALRKARAQAMARQQEQEQAAAAMQEAVDLSGAAKNLGQTPLGPDGQTAMSALLGGLGGL